MRQVKAISRSFHSSILHIAIQLYFQISKDEGKETRRESHLRQLRNTWGLKEVPVKWLT